MMIFNFKNYKNGMILKERDNIKKKSKETKSMQRSLLLLHSNMGVLQCLIPQLTWHKLMRDEHHVSLKLVPTQKISCHTSINCAHRFNIKNNNFVFDVDRLIWFPLVVDSVVLLVFDFIFLLTCVLKLCIKQNKKLPPPLHLHPLVLLPQ